MSSPPPMEDGVEDENRSLPDDPEIKEEVPEANEAAPDEAPAEDDNAAEAATTLPNEEEADVGPEPALDDSPEEPVEEAPEVKTEVVEDEEEQNPDPIDESPQPLQDLATAASAPGSRKQSVEAEIPGLPTEDVNDIYMESMKQSAKQGIERIAIEEEEVLTAYKGKLRPTKCKEEKDKAILRALQLNPPRHEYFGLLFSSETRRPPPYYSNYFLPFQRQPLPHQHVKILGKQIPTDDMLRKTMEAGRSIPPGAVKVRWMLNIRYTVYKAEDVYAYLIRYGPIEHVNQISPNSVVIVFAHIESALAAIRDPAVGRPWDPLIITWMDPRMNNFGNTKKHADLADAILQSMTGRFDF